MKHMLTILTIILLAPLTTLHAAVPDLSRIASRADLDTVIDASAVHLPKLKKLKRIMLNGGKMTAAWHGNLSSLPLESLSVSQGNSLPAAEAIAGARSIPTLRHCAMDGKTLIDADLTALASATRLDPRDTGRLAPCRY